MPLSDLHHTLEGIIVRVAIGLKLVDYAKVRKPRRERSNSSAGCAQRWLVDVRRCYQVMRHTANVPDLYQEGLAERFFNVQVVIVVVRGAELLGHRKYAVRNRVSTAVHATISCGTGRSSLE